MRIYFGLGSNLYDRLANLRDALTCLESIGRVIKASSVYSTPAWGGVSQPDYLNACALIESDSVLSPVELLTTIKNFESKLGRVPSVRWGERKIDIDILLIDNMIYSSPELNIPHVSLPERLFVLVPLRELLTQEWTHPVNNKTLGEMIEALAGREPQPLRVTNLL
ncbi:MAG: 2-amino-4-hydroxy-6-hydroxymethyldihydropteridine diphosphokinase [Synergistaceae bacterium]|nr:2-amino-4-hydroxy-6-hydroxymethyldihydropteridine diphosphokinase [Synergistaceae bacterium]